MTRTTQQTELYNVFVAAPSVTQISRTINGYWGDPPPTYICMFAKRLATSWTYLIIKMFRIGVGPQPPYFAKLLFHLFIGAASKGIVWIWNSYSTVRRRLKYSMHPPNSLNRIAWPCHANSLYKTDLLTSKTGSVLWFFKVINNRPPHL